MPDKILYCEKCQYEKLPQKDIEKEDINCPNCGNSMILVCGHCLDTGEIPVEEWNDDAKDYAATGTRKCLCKKIEEAEDAADANRQELENEAKAITEHND